MFRTDDDDILGIPGLFGEGVTQWHAVTRLLATHWFHVALERFEEGRWWQSVEMIGDEGRLQRKLIAQGPEMVVRDVQVNTPPYMNGSPSWKMEKLISVTVGQDAHECFVSMITVEGGATYNTSHVENFDESSLVKLSLVFQSSMLSVAAH